MTDRRLVLVMTMLIAITVHRGHASELDNGLQVLLEPEPLAPQAAVVLFFDVGEIHDPPGRSGLAHYIEHLWVTAATAKRPARTARAWMMGAGGLANAQTGRRYTFIATTVDRAGLDAVLVDLAERMSSLQVEQSDLDRELPRVANELTNMYGAMPSLAAMNLARHTADPLPPGLRKGGRPEDLRGVTPQDISARLAAYYTPNHATLVVAGGFIRDELTPRIAELFGPIDKGGPAPPARPGVEPRIGKTFRHKTPAMIPNAASAAALAFRVPTAGDDDFPAFLLLVGRLFRSAQFNPNGFPIVYAPLDDPSVLFVQTTIQDGETDDAIATRLRSQLNALLGDVDDPGQDRAAFTSMVGVMFSAPPPPVAMRFQNPYLVALSRGRMHQFGLAPWRVTQGIEGVTAEDLARVRQSVFGEGRGAIAIVEVE